jgi:hypothetical protein
VVVLVRVVLVPVVSSKILEHHAVLWPVTISSPDAQIPASFCFEIPASFRFQFQVPHLLSPRELQMTALCLAMSDATTILRLWRCTATAFVENLLVSGGMSDRK